jgi:hypothetical protein
LRETYTIPQAWQALGLPGEPKEHGDMRSPFRDERKPSFSIHSNGTAWKDHGTGEGGDVIEFIRMALDTDHAGVREWGKERIGLSPSTWAPPRRKATQRPPEPPKVIEWPGELVEGSQATWSSFAQARGLSPEGISLAVSASVLRFLRVDERKCFCITDETRRAAEIRDIRGALFGDRKAFPLRGVDKRWLPGLALLSRASAESGVLITEGATDLLSAYDLYRQFRKGGGKRSWVPCAMLGANCKTLSPEAEGLIRGRRVRLVPDGDEAGDAMANHWRSALLALGCTVDVVKLPRGSDLSDMRQKLNPEDLFA